MIFGIQAPKFSAGGTEVLLDNVVVLKDEPEHHYLELESEIDKTRTFYSQGYNWLYRIRIQIWKVGETDNPDALPESVSDKFIELMGYLGDTVTLWRHRDGNAIKDSSGTAVEFFITEVTPIYFETVKFRDAVIMEFKSTKPIDLTKSTIQDLGIADDQGNLIYDDLGNNLL